MWSNEHTPFYSASRDMNFPVSTLRVNLEVLAALMRLLSLILLVRNFLLNNSMK
jgi:hypothetical protein